MTHDEAFAQGWRLAWRWFPITALVAIGGFMAMAAIGYWWEQIEIANAIQRAVQ